MRKITHDKEWIIRRKYYYVWIVSILLFFGTFFFSVNSYITDSLTVILITIFALAGLFGFVRLTYSIVKRKTNGHRLKYISLYLAGFLLFFVLAIIDPPIVRYTPDESSLRKTIEEQRKINIHSDRGLRETYEKFLSTSFKNSYTENDFVQNNLSYFKSKGIINSKSELHDIYINGTEGYADRTVYWCTDMYCNSISEQTRSFKKYIYENNHWLLTDDEVVCPRSEPHDMAPEFAQAIKLISQSLDTINNFQYVKNCINVTYAENDDQINGAEGVFTFIPGQSLLNLDIKVSPRYKSQDINMIAFLLAHEGEHAANYAISLLTGEPMDCFEDEGRAFNAQYWFLQNLIPQEKNSLIERIYNDDSPEVQSILSTFILIQNQNGTDFIKKATNVVKNNPFYQEQCKNNNS